MNRLTMERRTIFFHIGTTELDKARSSFSLIFPSKLILCCILLIFHIKCTESRENEEQYQSIVKPYALSSIYLSKLAETEETLLVAFKEYVKILKARSELVYTYIADYREGRKFLKTEEIATNPLAAYKMIRRLAKTVTAFLADVQADAEGKLLAEIDEFEKSSVLLPDEFDHQETLHSLMQMQYFYDLKPLDLIKGTIQKKQTRSKLTPTETQEIVEFSVKKGYFYLAMEWLQAHQQNLRKLHSLDLTQFGFKSIKDLNKALTDKHDADFDKNLAISYPYMYTSKLGNDPKELPKTMKKEMLEKSKKSKTEILGIAVGGFSYNYLQLCNGIELMSEKEKSKLYCWLDTKRNPYFTISPLKLEYLHKDPLLLRIHDIINDKWIEEIKNVSYGGLLRAPEPKDREDTVRRAIYAWLDDEEIPNVPISRLHELLFDLNTVGTNASEFLQIASYALGGLVSLHVDYMGGITLENLDAEEAETAELDSNVPDEDLSASVLEKGDRVSSFLVYLNDVELGGYTAFPKLKTFVQPIKGSALFWYTSLRNGRVDARTLHGACPILYGHKWIATKWVHQFQNFLKRPCALDPNL